MAEGGCCSRYAVRVQLKVVVRLRAWSRCSLESEQYQPQLAIYVPVGLENAPPHTACPNLLLEITQISRCEGN